MKVDVEVLEGHGLLRSEWQGDEQRKERSAHRRGHSGVSVHRKSGLNTWLSTKPLLC